MASGSSDVFKKHTVVPKDKTVVGVWETDVVQVRGDVVKAPVPFPRLPTIGRLEEAATAATRIPFVLGSEPERKKYGDSKEIQVDRLNSIPKNI